MRLPGLVRASPVPADLHASTPLGVRSFSCLSNGGMDAITPDPRELKPGVYEESWDAALSTAFPRCRTLDGHEAALSLITHSGRQFVSGTARARSVLATSGAADRHLTERPRHVEERPLRACPEPVEGAALRPQVRTGPLGPVFGESIFLPMFRSMSKSLLESTREMKHPPQIALQKKRSPRRGCTFDQEEICTCFPVRLRGAAAAAGRIAGRRPHADADGLRGEVAIRRGDLIVAG